MALFLNGTAGNDTLTGSTGNDTLIGNAGNDYLDGGAGGDSLLGGTGNDTYVVDSTADVLIESAQEGIDQILSSISYTLAANFEALTLTGNAAINGTGNNLGNTLQGNAANNVLTTGSGADFLFGNAGNDTLISGAGDDYLAGGIGADSLVGGLGDDVYAVEDANDVIVEKNGEGYDEIRTSVSYTLSPSQYIEALTLSGTASISGTGNGLNNDIVGNRGDNSLQGLSGNDWLSGGLGNDLLNGGSGDDTMEGGAGNDTYFVDSASDQVIESSLSGGIDQVVSLASFSLQGKYVEKLTLVGTSNINGTGNDLGNTLIGNAGDNQLSTGSGNDYLDGGAGNDQMLGGSGNDSYVLDNFKDSIVEGLNEGWDSVSLASGYTTVYRMPDNIEAAKSYQTAGAYILGNTLDNLISGTNVTDVLLGGVGNDTLYGYDGDDTLYSGDGNNTVFGGNGNDELQGSGRLYGEAGDDFFNFDINTIAFGGKGNDTYSILYTPTAIDSSLAIVENKDEGWDTVNSNRSYTLPDNIEELYIGRNRQSPVDEEINGTGNSSANVIFADNSNNTLYGKAGNDTLNGGEGGDSYFGGFDADQLIDTSISSNDVYHWGRNEGADVASDAGGVSDELQLDAGVYANQVWLRQIGADLELSILGGTDTFTIKDWYFQGAGKIESIQLSDGKELTSGAVEGLVSVMASFTKPTGNQMSIPADQTTLINAVNSSWT